jgi:hypothetical protein
VPINLTHFLVRARDSGDWKEETITQTQFIDLLQEKIATLSFNNVKEDIVRFIRDDKALEIWSPKYFSDLVERIQFK